MPGFLAAPLAKLANIGTLTKAAATVAAAALTMTVAGGAAGVLALPGGQADTDGAAHVAPAQATARVDAAVTSSPSPAGAGASAVSRSTVTSKAGSSSGSTTVATSAKAAQPTPPTVPTPPRAANVGAPALPALPAIPSCVRDLIPTGGTTPDPMALVSKLPACIMSVISSSLPLDAILAVIRSANLPVDLSKCLSSVLSSIPALAAGDLSRLPQLLAGCLPTGSFPGMGSMPGMSPASGLRSGR